MLFSAHSLAYPFGSDQSVYHIVARWYLAHGAAPYRDTFDHKTPGIYALHALLIRVFGEGIWPIRLVEWLLMVPLGLGLAIVASADEEARRPPAWLCGLG